MKTMKTLLLLLCCFTPVAAYAYEAAEEQTRPRLKDPKEIIDLQLSSLDHLLERTQLTLAQITHLRQEVAHYQIVQERYLQDVEDRQLLSAMLHSAELLLNSIKSTHMDAIFDGEFISELSLLSQLNKKMGLPKPPIQQP